MSKEWTRIVKFNLLQKLLKEDGYYTIRVPSNVLDPPGRDFVVSSVRAVSKQPVDFLIFLFNFRYFLPPCSIRVSF